MGSESSCKKIVTSPNVYYILQILKNIEETMVNPCNLCVEYFKYSEIIYLEYSYS